VSRPTGLDVIVAPDPDGYRPVPPTDDRLLAAVQSELTMYLQARTALAGDIDPAFAEATEALADFVLSGGKRIRPTFAWWGWRGAGGLRRVDGTGARRLYP
jgi:geranylgeranyl diphosphate synthase type I